MLLLFVCGVVTPVWVWFWLLMVVGVLVLNSFGLCMRWSGCVVLLDVPGYFVLVGWCGIVAASDSGFLFWVGPRVGFAGFEVLARVGDMASLAFGFGVWWVGCLGG